MPKLDEALAKLEALGLSVMGEIDGLCWKNRHHPTEPRCQNAGVYGNEQGLTTFDRACRWCVEHRQSGDYVVAPAPEGE